MNPIIEHYAVNEFKQDGREKSSNMENLKRRGSENALKLLLNYILKMHKHGEDDGKKSSC